MPSFTYPASSPFIYPASDYDRPELLLSLLGSFWANTYDGHASLQGYTWARARAEQQSHDNLLEAVSAVSRHTVPLAHTQRWSFVKLLESQRNASDASLLRYGDNASYGPQPETYSEYKYGVPAGSSPFVFPLPAGLKDVPLIYNRIIDPSEVLVRDVDFIVDPVRGSWSFREDPFTNDLFPRRELFQGNEVVDREIGLWAVQARYDYGWIHTHWGYVAGVNLPSTAGYRDLLNAFFDGLVQGTDLETIQDLVAALTGIPTVLGELETVQEIVNDGHRWLVVTDQQVYKLPATSQLLVTAGQKIKAGQPLCDSVQFYELNRGQGPDLSGLSLDQSYLVGAFHGSLQFNNGNTPLVVTYDENGITRAEFEIGGDPADVRLFWDHVHTEGVANGLTFAQMLDTRESPTSQPRPENLPSTINPLEFVFTNLFRNNVFFVRIRVTDLDERALGLHHLRLVRQLTPPHTSLIVVLELALSEAPVIMEGPGTELVPGYVESAAIEPALDLLTDVASPPTMSRPHMRQSSAGCL